MKHIRRLTRTPQKAATTDTLLGLAPVGEYDPFQQLLIVLTKGMAAKFF